MGYWWWCSQHRWSCSTTTLLLSNGQRSRPAILCCFVSPLIGKLPGLLASPAFWANMKRLEAREYLFSLRNYSSWSNALGSDVQALLYRASQVVAAQCFARLWRKFAYKRRGRKNAWRTTKDKRTSFSHRAAIFYEIAVRRAQKANGRASQQIRSIL